MNFFLGELGLAGSGGISKVFGHQRLPRKKQRHKRVTPNIHSEYDC